MCLKRAECERETASWEERENDRHGWRKGKEWETTPERLCGEPAAPSQHSSSLPPCVLCHGYQTGLPVQPVNVFFSGRNERGTNVSRSVSYTINVNCPGMHKHMEGGGQPNRRTTWMWKTSLHVTWKLTLSLVGICRQKSDSVKKLCLVASVRNDCVC